MLGNSFPKRLLVALFVVVTLVCGKLFMHLNMHLNTAIYPLDLNEFSLKMNVGNTFVNTTSEKYDDVTFSLGSTLRIGGLSVPPNSTVTSRDEMELRQRSTTRAGGLSVPSNSTVTSRDEMELRQRSTTRAVGLSIPPNSTVTSRDDMAFRERSTTRAGGLSVPPNSTVTSRDDMEFRQRSTTRAEVQSVPHNSTATGRDDMEFRLRSTLVDGGKYIPPNSTVTSRVAILVPYRDRAEHLRVFLNHMHPFLQKQSIMYGIYVIEIDQTSKFNRGILLNIGFVEALKEYNYTCIVLHDVDMLPEDERIPYTCPNQPRHLSVFTSRFNYRLPYGGYFGGVSAISTEHYKQINGMSNMFFGWGGEDDELYQRILHHNMTMIRPAGDIARYKMSAHQQDADLNPMRLCLLQSTRERSIFDGLNNLKYTLLVKEHRPLYTWVFIRANSTEILENEHLYSFYKKCK